MKKVILALSAFALIVTLTAFAQYGSNPSDQTKSDTMKSDKASAKAVSVSGKIGDDGKTFVSDKDGKTWTISNPDVVKGHEEHKVTLKGHLNSDTNEIQVVSVKMGKNKMKQSSTVDEKPPK
jgi:hypothetical protein